MVQAVVGHNRQIFQISLPFFGSVNDATAVNFVPLVVEMRNGQRYADLLYDCPIVRKVDNVEKRDVIRMQGAWIIADNGYHTRWSQLMSGKMAPSSTVELFVTNVMTSWRKDVECVFGILKKRFLILKYGLRLRDIASIQSVILACAILHNMLLKFDGLHEWEVREEDGAPFIDPSSRKLRRGEIFHEGTTYTPTYSERWSCIMSSVITKQYERTMWWPKPPPKRKPQHDGVGGYSWWDSDIPNEEEEGVDKEDGI